MNTTTKKATNCYRCSALICAGVDRFEHAGRVFCSICHDTLVRQDNAKNAKRGTDSQG